jgi:DNA-binding response OmpR family regulator
MVMNPNANSDAVVLALTAPFRLGMVQVLVALARAKGVIVTRDELIASCWAGRIVSNDAVSRVISHLRLLAVGIAAGSFQMETLPRIGYRLTVQEGEGAEAPSPILFLMLCLHPCQWARSAVAASLR